MPPFVRTLVFNTFVWCQIFNQLKLVFISISSQYSITDRMSLQCPTTRSRSECIYWDYEESLLYLNLLHQYVIRYSFYLPARIPIWLSSIRTTCSGWRSSFDCSSRRTRIPSSADRLERLGRFDYTRSSIATCRRPHPAPTTWTIRKIHVPIQSLPRSQRSSSIDYLWVWFWWRERGMEWR